MRRNRVKTINESIVRHLVAGLDATALLGAGVAAMHWNAATVDWHLAGLVVLLGTVLALNFLHLFGAYRFDGFARVESAVGRVLVGWLCAFGMLFLATRLFEPVNAADGPWAAAWFSTAFALMGFARFALWRQMLAWGRAGRLGERVAIVGAGPVAQRLLRSLAARKANLRIFGVYDDQAASLPRACMGYPIRGTVDDLVKEAREQHIDTVIVALPLARDRELVETLNRLCLVPVHVRLCPDAFGLRLGQVQASYIAGHTFLNVVDRPLCGWHAIAKEVEDRVLGAVILALIAPLMLAIALMIKLDSPGPVLFRQKRYGFNNQLIEIFKFRSMYTHMTDHNAERLTQRNDPRITRVGAFLRRTSLDELPQFLNVVRGEMSIVGPRPHALAAKAGSLLYQEAVKYYDARHRVKPGITGWAQVNGWRGETDTVEQIRKRVEHDLYYIENWSVLLDLKIIARTIVGGFTGQHAF
ncbi:MAG TPA: undecaprenyl-phosphate glucose phosphotransferase [Reyranella sp.]|nr:undecaprenyl-phosphate glucose phosphotransferase [Reyranella sp.]